MASRVLPIPPGPTSVSKRQEGSASRSAISANSVVRPMKAVDWTGRLLVVTGVPLLITQRFRKVPLYISRTYNRRRLGQQGLSLSILWRKRGSERGFEQRMRFAPAFGSVFGFSNNFP